MEMTTGGSKYVCAFDAEESEREKVRELENENSNLAHGAWLVRRVLYMTNCQM